mmetsp:Transcript_9280/g.22122  ORF Transcript_9280/g.22122 Transcript_9280/m.22122 type:complete len:394 (-) Transcript_9280:20-1201(-)
MAPSCPCSVVLVLALRLCVAPAREETLDDELRFHFDCATRCAAMTASDREAIKAMYRAAGCDVGGPGAHPVCASSMEQLCVGSCGGGQQDMATFLPGAFGPGAAPVGSEPFSVALQVHRDCAERCASEGIAVSADSGAEKAVDTLRRCGVVQLLGAYDLTALDRFQKAFDQLKAKEKAYKKLLDTKQLHDGRYQVYLPFAKPFSSRETLGVSDLVLKVLHAYFMTSGGSFGIDHVSVLTSASGSANQSLHPDVHYFKGLSVSVHTALHDIPSSLGPTYFCPCTGESLTREDWPASAAIKMTILKRKDCLARSFAPSFTARGTVTIYDGAMFHKGLENGSGRDRPVLKLEVAAEEFAERRNYIQLASGAAKKQVRRFREAMGPPHFGESRRQEL